MPTTEGSSQIDLLVDGTLKYVVRGRHLPIFEGLSLALNQGSRLAIIGPNGCGKSSLLKVLLHFLPLSSGRVTIELTDLDYLSAIIQDYRQLLLLGETVATNLSLPFGGGRRMSQSLTNLSDTTLSILTSAGYQIDAQQTVGYLSGGQQQALVLARSLAMQPQCFFWDEPLSAIDFAKRGTFYQLIQNFWNRTHASGVIITHDIDEAVILGDRVVVFDARMSPLFDQQTPTSTIPKGREYLASEETKSYQAAIRNAMYGNHSTDRTQ